MAVVKCIPLGVADTMGVVTDRAGRVLIDDMFLMLGKTLISQDTAPAVAFIAHGIIRGALRRVVEGYIVALEQKFINGAMGAQWSVGIVGIMTICAGYRAGNCQRSQKARYVGIYSG